MRFDRYMVFARLLPAVLSSMPIYAAVSVLGGSELKAIIAEWSTIKTTGGAAIGSIALWYALMTANRTISKFLFERKQFVDELDFPTTRMLLHSDTSLTAGYKARLHQKIHDDFGVQIPDANTEATNGIESRRIIAEAVGLVRKTVGSPKMLLQHNIEYGFIRNLAGGAVLALAASLIFLAVSAVFPTTSRFIVFGTCGALSVLVLIVRPWAMKRYGDQYATILFREYLAK